MKYAPILLDEEEQAPIGLIGDSYFAFSLGEERDITDNVVDSIVDSCLLLPHSGKNPHPVQYFTVVTAEWKLLDVNKDLVSPITSNI